MSTGWSCTIIHTVGVKKKEELSTKPQQYHSSTELQRTYTPFTRHKNIDLCHMYTVLETARMSIYTTTCDNRARGPGVRLRGCSRSRAFLPSAFSLDSVLSPCKSRRKGESKRRGSKELFTMLRTKGLAPWHRQEVWIRVILLHSR